MPKPVYIVSDIHLGAVPRETERHFVSFLDHVATHASRLIVNGDLTTLSPLGAQLGGGEGNDVLYAGDGDGSVARGGETMGGGVDDGDDPAGPAARVTRLRASTWFRLCGDGNARAYRRVLGELGAQARAAPRPGTAAPAGAPRSPAPAR